MSRLLYEGEFIEARGGRQMTGPHSTSRLLYEGEFIEASTGAGSLASLQVVSPSV